MDVEDQEQATTEASTIDTTSNLDSGKISEMGNNVDTATESNAFMNNVHSTSDIADICPNKSTQNDIHNSGLFPMHTETMFPNPCTCNEMLSQYNCILIGYFKDIFSDCGH